MATQVEIANAHQHTVEQFEIYLAENAKFSEKGVKAAAGRARKALQEIGKGLKQRRKEITDEKAAMSAK